MSDRAPSGANVSHYRVVAGLEHETIPAEIARVCWDATPAEMRSGDRQGAFILWVPNHLGWRGSPVIFKPV